MNSSLSIALSLDPKDPSTARLLRGLADLVAGLDDATGAAPTLALVTPAAEAPADPEPAQEPCAPKRRRVPKPAAAASQTEAPASTEKVAEVAATNSEPAAEDVNPHEIRSLMAKLVSVHAGDTSGLESLYKKHQIRKATDLDTPAKRTAFVADLRASLTAGKEPKS